MAKNVSSLSDNELLNMLKRITQISKPENVIRDIVPLVRQLISKAYSEGTDDERDAQAEYDSE